MLKKIIYAAIIIFIAAVIALKLGWLSPKGENVVYNIIGKLKNLVTSSKKVAEKGIKELEKPAPRQP
ncbi:MAG TPA: hypothetical protein VKS21_01260 [Spirochaetota bacterium]|nr:hypothetical protein [Spirochaetota bacterium]